MASMRTPATLVPDAGWAEQVRRQRSQGHGPSRAMSRVTSPPLPDVGPVFAALLALPMSITASASGQEYALARSENPLIEEQLSPRQSSYGSVQPRTANPTLEDRFMQRSQTPPLSGTSPRPVAAQGVGCGLLRRCLAW